MRDTKTKPHKTKSKLGLRPTQLPKGRKENIMKKNIFSINFTEQTISGSKSALKKASNPASAEYKELTTKMALHPTFKIVEKEPNTNKTTYKGMGFKMMADYISTQENAEELMAEFETAKLMFGGKYPLVKKWFLDTFKDEADTFKVSEAKKTIATAKVNRVKATVKKAPSLHVANPGA